MSLLQPLHDDVDDHDYIDLTLVLRKVVLSVTTPNTCDCLSRQTRMTDSSVLQGGRGRRIIIRDLMDGQEDIVRNPDGQCVVVQSVSVSVCVLVGVAVVMIVTVLIR